MDVGFVGLGNMGGHMCANLIRAGHSVTAYDVRKEALDALAAKGAAPAPGAEEVARRSEISFTSLPHPKVSEEVILGEGGLLAGAKRGSLIVELSTVTPSLVKRMARAAADRGVELIDAPVSGGVDGAAAGTLSIMVGGSAAAFGRAKPLLEVIGKSLFHCGETGMGMVFKVVNNILSHVNVAALVEAISLGVAAGADPELLCEVIAHSSGNSEQHRRRFRGRVLKGNFEPGMTTVLATKDSEIGLELAREQGVPMFLATAAHTVYEMGLKKGLGPKDYCSLVQIWEEWLGIRVRGKDAPAG